MIAWPEELPSFDLGELRLRPWLSEDAQQVYEICQDPILQNFTTVPVPYTFEDSEKFLTRQRSGFETGTDFALAGEVAGKIALCISAFDAIPFEHIVKIGYWAAPAFRGQGFTSRAVIAVTDFLFSIGFRRVSADTMPDNIGSQRTLLKAGYYFESTQKMAMTARDGSQIDGLVFAKLAPDYYHLQPNSVD